MAKKIQPKKNYADLLGNLKKTASEMEKQKQAGKPSTTGNATVTSNDNKPALADTSKPSNVRPATSSEKADLAKNKATYGGKDRVIVNDRTSKKGTTVWRVDKKTAEEIKKKAVKRAIDQGAKKVTTKTIGKKK